MMKKETLGRIAIILGSLFLAIELYGLKIIQLLYALRGESWVGKYIFRYAQLAPINIALFITVGVIVYGFFLIYSSRKNNNDRK